MEISEILIAPDTKENLSIDWKQGTIQNLNNDLFDGKILNGVPSILPKNKKSSTTDLHETTNSEFDYVDHYIKDAQEFDYFEKADEITENERTRLNQLIMEKIGSGSNRILDVGCGNGWLSKMVEIEQTQMVSLDISQINVQRALKEQPHQNHFGVVADVFHLPFLENSFDVIVASEIIEHVYDPKAFVACLLKILKPGGKLIITTPYNEKIPLSLCVHCNRPTPRHAHLHSFNESNVKQLVNGEVKNFNVDKSANNHLLKLRIYWMLRAIPFKLWHLLDSLAIKLLGKPTRLIMEIVK